MKKLLFSSAAVCALALVPAAAQAQVSLDLGGFFKGYAFYTDQDDDPAAATPGTESRNFDIIRNTEVSMSGETTLDNGLTVGVHMEMEADGSTGAPGASDSFNVEESYAYFSGDWGRVNFGSEDGAAYLLQVAAPSGDSNIDGLRQHVNPVNYAIAQGGAVPVGAALAGAVAGVAADGIDYDQDVTRTTDKLTYLSPNFNGFQVGLSYTPDAAGASTEDALNLDNVAGAFGQSYEAAARYEGTFNNVGVIIGGGYTFVQEEASTAPQVAGTVTDDRTAWNAGIDLDIGPFGIGASYMEDDFGDTALSVITEQDEEQTIVVGVDYTTGPFKLGASYMDQDGTNNIVGRTGTDGVETKRYTGGVIYTYGPGMTFRGSISHIQHDNVAGRVVATDDKFDATSVTVGTQINF